MHAKFSSFTLQRYEKILNCASKSAIIFALRVRFFASLRWLQKYVCEVGVGGVLLQSVGDGVFQSFGLRHHFLPLPEASAVGEEDEASASQAFELFGVQSTASCCSKPEVLRLRGCHDESRLFAFHEADLNLWT